jgi:putative ABC transport system permease protein
VKLLFRSSRRYLIGHGWQFGLSIVGVALGVAVVVAVDLASESAQRAFSLSSAAVGGRATHNVVGGPRGLDEAVFVELRAGLGLRAMAPVVEGYVAFGARPLRLLGIDPFSEAGVRPRLATGPASLDLPAFLGRPGAVIASRQTATRLGVGIGEPFEVQAGAVAATLTIAGWLPTDQLADEAAVADLLIADISTAQEVLRMGGRLSRIDLVLDGAAGGAALARIDAALPAGVRLVAAEPRAETGRQMTRAFRVNLTALSLLALLCGAFLVYNTVSFSVVQRRPLIGAMRAIGVTRRQVLGLVLAEATAVGVAGTLIGVAGGIAIGRLLIDLVTRTINDLYFVLAVGELAVAPISLLKGTALGVGGTLLAAVAPALEATGAPPRATLTRSYVEARARRLVAPAAFTGVALLVAGGLLLAVSGGNLAASFAGLFVTILGFAVMTPAAVVLAMWATTRPLGWALGPVGRIASRGVATALSRTAVAVAALMIALSVVIGVAVMIDSFRSTVGRWLDNVLVADLYISAPGLGPVTQPLAIAPSTLASIREVPGVERLGSLRSVELTDPDGTHTRLIVFERDDRDRGAFDLAAGDPDAAWEAFAEGGAVLVTEPYAYRNRIGVGDQIELATDRGPRRFTVAGVYYNYASDIGFVAMDRATYLEHWEDPDYSGISVVAAPGADLEAIGEAIRARLDPQQVVIQSNRALREATLEVFDRTFLITGVLRTLVTLVAVIGVLSALMSLQLERQREVGVLRALGLTPGEVWGLAATQAGLIGLVSAVLALPVGLSLAAITVSVINRRSFGWTLRTEVDPAILLQALAVGLLAALAAGLYPAFRMARTRPSVALREE